MKKGKKREPNTIVLSRNDCMSLGEDVKNRVIRFYPKCRIYTREECKALEKETKR